MSKAKIWIVICCFALVSCSNKETNTSISSTITPTLPKPTASATYKWVGFDQKSNVYYLKLNVLSQKLGRSGQYMVKIGSYAGPFSNTVCSDPTPEPIVCVSITPEQLNSLEMNAPIVVSGGGNIYFGAFDKQNFEPKEQIRPLRKDALVSWEKTFRATSSNPGLAPTFIPDWSEHIAKLEAQKKQFAETLEDKYWNGESNLTSEGEIKILDTDVELADFISQNPKFIQYFDISFFVLAQFSTRGLANKAIKDATEAGYQENAELKEAMRLFTEADSTNGAQAVHLYRDAYRKAARLNQH